MKCTCLEFLEHESESEEELAHPRAIFLNSLLMNPAFPIQNTLDTQG